MRNSKPKRRGFQAWLKSTVAGNNHPPFRARMEAQGEDSDGLDYESPVELEQATRAAASSGSPSRQILARCRRPGRFAGQWGCPPRRAQHTRTSHEPRVAHPHSHDTTHRPRTATGARHPGRAAWWALRLPGRRRGRRDMPASTSTTETPQPGRATVSVRRSRPPTGHRRAAGGDATTTAPPLPDRRAEGGF